MVSSKIQRFNTHETSDEAILALATGRDDVRHYVSEKIIANLNSNQRQRQHVLMSAPRGFGKSFMTRLAEIDTHALAKGGAPVRFILLPEEQRNVTSPSGILKEIRRILNNETWDKVTSMWIDDDDKAWDHAVVDLDATIDDVFAHGEGLIVVALENFDMLLDKIFKAEDKQTMLRKWMTRKGNRVMLLATTTNTVHLDYNKPIFQAFSDIQLDPWTEDDCIVYFNRLRAFKDEPSLDSVQEAKARAIANFIGGNPRLARLLGEVLTTRDILTVTETLDTLVDELADYYRRQIDDLGDKARVLVDALMRGGEPRSQSELAERVGTTQNRIAQAFSELQRGLLVTGERATASRETLYRMTDRVFVHFYRTRYGGMAHDASPLGTIMDFLESFFSLEEKRTEATRFLAEGKPRESRILADLAWSEAGPAPWTKLQRYQYRNKAKFDIYFSAIKVDAENALRQAVELLAEKPEITYETAQNYLSGKLPPGEAVLWFVLAARAAAGLGLNDESERFLNDAVSKTESDPALICVAHRERGYLSLHLTNDKEQAVKDFERSGSQEDDIVARCLKSEALTDKAFAQGILKQHEEALDTLRKAASVAEAADDKKAQAVALRYAAWNLGELKHHEEAIGAARRATWVAKELDDKWEQAVALGHAAWDLGQLNRHEEAIETARAAVSFAEEAGDKWAIATTIARLVQSSRYVKASDCVEAFAKWLTVAKASEQLECPNPAIYLDNLFAATTRARLWPSLLDLWYERKDWFESSVSRWDFDAPGSTLVDIAAKSGRAEAYSTAVEFLDAISPIILQETDAIFVSAHPKTIVQSSLRFVAQQCDQFGFLRDLESYIRDIFKDGLFSNEIVLLNAAAAYHSSGRDPAALERVDPDIATAIKRVWNAIDVRK